MAVVKVIKISRPWHSFFDLQPKDFLLVVAEFSKWHWYDLQISLNRIPRETSRAVLFNLYHHTLFTPLYAMRGSFGPGNI